MVKVADKKKENAKKIANKNIQVMQKKLLNAKKIAKIRRSRPGDGEKRVDASQKVADQILTK